MLIRVLTIFQTAATIIYAIIGGSGYLMFGDNVSDEVSIYILIR